MVGTRYWAKQALTSVLSSLLANNMQQLLQQPEEAQDKPEMGALLVVNSLCHAWLAMLTVIYLRVMMNELVTKQQKR